MAEPKLKARRVRHATFHLGVQFGSKVHTSLNEDKHKCEMWAMTNGELWVLNFYDFDWSVPTGVQHVKQFYPEENK